MKLNPTHTSFKKRTKLSMAIAALALLASGNVIAGTAYNGPHTLPGTIEAEDYDSDGSGVSYSDSNSGNTGGAYRSDNVDIEVGGSGHNVGWCADGEWLLYTVDVPTAGNYYMEAQIASGANGGSVYWEFAGSTTVTTTTESFGNTGGWGTFTGSGATDVFALNSGTHTIKMHVSSGMNVDNFTITSVSQSSYNSPAPSLPGTIQMEEYDNGGDGVAFSDTTANQSDVFGRGDNVDTDGGGTGYSVNYTAPGEWLKYQVEVPSAGTYGITCSTTTPHANGEFHFDISGATTVTSAALFAPDTNGWNNYADTNTVQVALNAGAHEFKYTVDGGEYNIDYCNITSAAQSGPYSGTALDLPGTIELEEYDLGGDGVAFNDETANQNDDFGRGDRVDTTVANGGYGLGYTSDGDWSNYTVNFPTAGTYEMDCEAASPNTGGEFQFIVSGATTFTIDSFNVPDTGNWGTYTKTNSIEFTVNAGTHVFKYDVVNAGYNIDSCEVREVPWVKALSINIWGWQTMPQEAGYYASMMVTHNADVMGAQETPDDWQTGYSDPDFLPDSHYQRAFDIKTALDGISSCWDHFYGIYINTCRGNAFVSTARFNLTDGPNATRTGEMAVISKDGQNYTFINVHWDHEASSTRFANATETGNEADAATTPVIIVGDLNAQCHSPEANSMASTGGVSLLVHAGIDCMFSSGFGSASGSIVLNEKSDHPDAPFGIFTKP